jgi:UDP-glucose 4-epimerase
MQRSRRTHLKTALITGGAGFIGQAVSKQLTEHKNQVYIFEPSHQTDTRLHRRGSLLNFSDVAAAIQGIEVVYHLGGLLGTTELLRQSAEAVDVNIKGTVHVLEACRLVQVRRVFYPTKPNEWLNTYSITKKAGEEFAHMYRQIYGLDVRVLRWLNVYGPGQKIHPVRKAIPMMIFQALNELPIEVFGDGEQPVDLIYKDDLARITTEYMALDRVEPLTRDTGCTIRMTVNALAGLIKQMTLSPSVIRHLPMRPGEEPAKPVKLLDSETAADLLGLNHIATKLEEGLAATIKYYQDLPQDTINTVLAYYAPRHR